MRKLSREEMKNVKGGYNNGPKGATCFAVGVVCGASSGAPTIPCCDNALCLPNPGGVFSCQ